MINLTAAVVLGCIASKRKQKRNYRRTKVDPYEALGNAYAWGFIDDIDDALRFQAVMNSVGAYDIVDENKPLGEKNRYAWRLNCLDGLAYGVDPEDYETREEYNEALEFTRNVLMVADEELDEYGESAEESEEYSENIMDEIDEDDCTCCKVSRLDNGKNEFYMNPGLDIDVGDIVIVPTEDGEAEAVVLQTGLCDDEIWESISGEIERKKE